MKKILATTVILPLMSISTFMSPAKAATSASDSIQALTTTTQVPETPELDSPLSQSLEDEKVAYGGCAVIYGWLDCQTY